MEDFISSLAMKRETLSFNGRKMGSRIKIINEMGNPSSSIIHGYTPCFP